MQPIKLLAGLLVCAALSSCVTFDSVAVSMHDGKPQISGNFTMRNTGKQVVTSEPEYTEPVEDLNPSTR